MPMMLGPITVACKEPGAGACSVRVIPLCWCMGLSSRLHVSVLDGNVALLRLKKGPVKKVCSAQMTDQAEAKQFVNLTAQAGGYWARNVTLSECG